MNRRKRAAPAIFVVRSRNKIDAIGDQIRRNTHLRSRSSRRTDSDKAYNRHRKEHAQAAITTLARIAHHDALTKPCRAAPWLNTNFPLRECTPATESNINIMFRIP